MNSFIFWDCSGHESVKLGVYEMEGLGYWSTIIINDREWEAYGGAFRCDTGEADYEVFGYPAGWNE